MNYKDRCKHCKRERGYHKANGKNCPIGRKSRIGYIMFHNTKIFELGKVFVYKSTDSTL